jgi:molybdopterin-guanine dinucleotide biosynthesis protein A
MRNDIAVVILAGGEGSRLGGAKPLRPFAGERLIDRALQPAAGWSDLVAVAVRDPAQVEPVDVPMIADVPDIEGPLGGLAAALHFGANGGREFVLTIPTDMPFLPNDLLDRLDLAISDLGCVLASSGGHVHPVCGLWRTSALDRLDEYLANGRRSLKGFAQMIGCGEVEWSIDPLDPFFNINTADELTRAERHSGG